jgi:tripartite-type tricarboxylate transporter receptor subunit TctC
MKKILIALIMGMSLVAHAWTPTKPITVVFPNGPGAGNEIGFRIVANIVERRTGAKFVADYKPGADGNIGMSYFNTLPNDGYHVAMPSCQSTFVTYNIWYPKAAKFDPYAWEGVANIGKAPLAFWAKKDSKVKNPQDLIDLLRSGKPVTFAVGGAAHKLAVEYFIAGLHLEKDNVETILYKGPAQAMSDVLAGHVEFGVFPIAVGHPFIQDNKIKLLGLTSEKKVHGLEKYPLMKDYVPNLNVYACWNLMLPKNTPQEIQDWYHDNFVPVIRGSEAEFEFNKNFIFISPNEHSPEGVRAAMHRLRTQWEPFAKKVKPE